MVEPINHALVDSTQYLVFFKNNKYLRYQGPVINSYSYKSEGNAGSTLASINNTISIVGIFTRYASMKIYTYTIPPIGDIGHFVIGSDNNGLFSIQKKIKSIKILN